MTKLMPCPQCERQFIDAATLHEHADSVHTFDDIRGMVSEEVRETYGTSTNGPSGLSAPYTWVVDLADDWCVFQLEAVGSCKLMKVGYLLTGNSVTLVGEPFEVVRQTVYVAAPPEDE